MSKTNGKVLNSETTARHLPGISGASIVETPYLREVRAGFAHMVRIRAAPGRLTSNCGISNRKFSPLNKR